MDDLDKLLGGSGAWMAARCRRVDNVVADVFFNHFRDQPVKRSATGHDLLQNGRTIGFTLHGAFDRFQLAADAADPRQKLLLFRLSVCHR